MTFFFHFYLWRHVWCWHSSHYHHPPAPVRHSSAAPLPDKSSGVQLRESQSGANSSKCQRRSSVEAHQDEAVPAAGLVLISALQQRRNKKWKCLVAPSRRCILKTFLYLYRGEALTSGICMVSQHIKTIFSSAFFFFFFNRDRKVAVQLLL